MRRERWWVGGLEGSRESGKEGGRVRLWVGRKEGGREVVRREEGTVRWWVR